MVKRDMILAAVLVLIFSLVGMSCGGGDEDIDGDQADGDEAVDGDATVDGDAAVDGDAVVDGDEVVDGDAVVDGDMTDGDVADGDMIDGDADGDADGEVASIADPLPDANEPGEYGCEGCPDIEVPQDMVFESDLGAVTSKSISSGDIGIISGNDGDGVWYLEQNAATRATRRVNGGVLYTAEGGSYIITIPLFCGQQTLKLVWSNASGSYGLVFSLLTSDCTEDDIRVTLSWGAGANDLELHLIREGGKINVHPDDCTWTNMNPDWGVADDSADNPHKDVDHTGDNGVENIWLSSPEDIQYHVMVEYWATGNPITANLVVVLDGQTYVRSLADFQPKYVWDAAVIDWTARKLTWNNDAAFDCSGNWSSGCKMDVP